MLMPNIQPTGEFMVLIYTNAQTLTEHELGVILLNVRLIQLATAEDHGKSIKILYIPIGPTVWGFLILSPLLPFPCQRN